MEKLPCKNKSVKGSHQEFRAKAFACYENNVSVEINMEQNYCRQFQEY